MGILSKKCVAHEVVKVRVLFLEPGDKAFPSEFEDSLSDAQVREAESASDLYRPFEDYQERGFYRLHMQCLAEDLYTDYRFATPNDQAVEILKPIVLVRFECVDTEYTMDSTGMLAESVAVCGQWDVFKDWVPALIEHAQQVRAQRTDSDPDSPLHLYGRVHIKTLWSITTCASRFIDETFDDPEVKLLGYFENSAIPVMKLREASDT